MPGPEPEHVEQTRTALLATKRWLVGELLEEGRQLIPSEANFLKIDVGRDVEPVIEAFTARGIKVGRRFPALPLWLRVSMGTGPEMRTFLAALREIVPTRPA